MTLHALALGLRLTASVFPSFARKVVDIDDMAINIHALFAVHRFPFARISAWASIGEPRVALQIVVNKLNEMLHRGEIDDVNAILGEVRLDDEMAPVVVLGYLMMALPAAGHMPNFRPLVARVGPWLAKRYDPERAANLLSRYMAR